MKTVITNLRIREQNKKSPAILGRTAGLFETNFSSRYACTVPLSLLSNDKDELDRQ